MKKVVLITLIGISTLLISCQNNLTESKAKKLIEECYKKHPQIKTYKILLSREHTNNLHFNSTYVKFAKEGYLKYTEKSDMFGTSYEIKAPTEKLKPYIIEEEINTITIKAGIYELVSVNNIHEIPSMNMASVKITRKRIDDFPYSELLPQPTEKEIEQTIKMYKTNKGWVYCEE